MAIAFNWIIEEQAKAYQRDSVGYDWKRLNVRVAAAEEEIARQEFMHGMSEQTSMTVIVINKNALAVPEEVQRQAGIKNGDRLEFKVSGGIITIVPEVPDASDEYTPEQHKKI